MTASSDSGQAARLKRQERAYAELLKFSQVLTSTVDLHDLYATVTKLPKDLLGFDFSTLMLVTPDRNALVIKESIGFPENMIGTFALLKGQGLSTYVVVEKTPAVVYDFATEQRFEVPPVVFAKDIASALCVPMMIGQEVFGVLIGHTHLKRQFDDDEIQLYQSFANQAAVAIKNAMHLHSLHASEKKFRTLFDSTHDAIMIYDLDGRLIEVNDVACKRLGYSREELLAMEPGEFIASRYAAKLPQRIARVKERNQSIFETAHITKDGHSIPIELSCSYIEYGDSEAILGVARDISERKKMEEERLRAQKLESVGVLAGGIAHDFNNLLTGILGNLSLAQLYLPPESKVKEKLAETEKAAIRAQGLTQQLLTFSKGGTPVKETASLLEIIKDSTEFASRGSKSACEYDLAEDLWLVEADKGQISQVFQNLVINASHAMPEGGTIFVSASNTTLKKNALPPLAAGDYVQVTVQDQGSGIAREHLEKIFDPYFSTKENGSGLGLAVVYSIIKNHNGHITLESDPTEGTVFQIYLPVTDKSIAPEDKAPPVLTKGEGKILLMDDEDVVRRVAIEILTSLGYEAHTAHDGAEALKLYQQAFDDGCPFDLVVMDLTIPAGMGGKETVAKLLKQYPNAKAIVASGYANDPIMANFQEYGFKGVAPKPFCLKDFSSLIHRVLNEE